MGKFFLGYVSYVVLWFEQRYSAMRRSCGRGRSGRGSRVWPCTAWCPLAFSSSGAAAWASWACTRSASRGPPTTAAPTAASFQMAQHDVGQEKQMSGIWFPNGEKVSMMLLALRSYERNTPGVPVLSRMRSLPSLLGLTSAFRPLSALSAALSPMHPAGTVKRADGTTISVQAGKYCWACYALFA